MTAYKTGEETTIILFVDESSDREPVQSEVSYAGSPSWAESVRQEGRQSPRSSSSGQRPQHVSALTPSIRRELAETVEQLRLASEAMMTAHELDGVDVVELANAIEDYRQGVETLWQYRSFGTDAWRSVIVFCRQALCENMNDEEMTQVQCRGLKAIALSYLSNRHLAKDDVREVMQLLGTSGFDPMLFFSQTNQKC